MLSMWTSLYFQDENCVLTSILKVFTGRQQLLLHLLFLFSLSLSKFSAGFVISSHIKSSTPNAQIMTDGEEIMAVLLISV